MVIGNLVLNFYLPHADSLKSKRMVVRSVKEKLKSKFNVSVAEVGYQDVWQNAQIAVVLVAPDKFQVEKSLQSIVNFIESTYPDLYIDISREIF